MKWPFTCLLAGCMIAAAPMVKAQVASTEYIRTKAKIGFVRYPAARMHYDGYWGALLDKLIEKRVAAQDVEELVQVFRSRKENNLWQSEFWGKWMLCAAKAYAYSGDTGLYRQMKHSVDEIIATQSDDGYIGNYAPQYHLQSFDIWGRKYTLLGLLYFYDLSGDGNVLHAATRLADHLMTEVGPGKKNIVLTGPSRGMPSSSVLEPVVLLYERTGDARYLRFAEYIVRQWETPDGPRLISKAIAGVPVADRFPTPPAKDWWSRQNGAKAYDMMSCYDGLLKLYQHTGRQAYFQAVYRSAMNILHDEINLVGSGAAMECWYHGNPRQVFPAAHTMETCVTITWMKLCYELYRMTGEAKWVEEIERSVYNNLPGSLTPDDSQFSKYSALQGFRSLDDFQCGIKTNCCNANGPRGFLLLPDLGVMTRQDQVYINLYNAGKAKLLLSDSTALGITIESAYPVNGVVLIKPEPGGERYFGIQLRLPSWSAGYKVSVNGQELASTATAGGYLALNRKWKTGDVIRLELPMNGRVLTRREDIRTYKAIARGPVVLARDSRFGDVSIDAEIASIKEEKGKVELKEVRLAGVRMGFLVKFRYGPGEHTQEVEVPFVDFASAGNAWDPANRYRVWIPEIYDPLRPQAGH